MRPFIVFPAIDLRRGQVVRLKQGDPARQTVFGHDPAATARRWLSAGASWLHVVNLDGAFGEVDTPNLSALAGILQAAGEYNARVQFGGGLRSLEEVDRVLVMGVERAILGTVAAEQPEILATAIARFGAERVAAGVDTRAGLVQVRGWAEATATPATKLAESLSRLGLRWLIFTDVARDGIGAGLNLPATLELAQISGVNVIASGGVNGLADIHQAQAAGLAGVIVGRALYEGRLDIQDLRLFYAPDP